MKNNINYLKNEYSNKRKILIIEDDELNREMLVSLLEDQYEIITADNGESGLKLLEDSYDELSLILLDIQMPVLNGVEVLRHIKDDALLSSVPVIVLTVNDSIDTELTCLDLGASDFIIKPYNTEIIRKRIRNIIKLKESSLTLKAIEYDELTGLYTEQAFFHYAKQIMQFYPDNKLNLIEARIKDFKLINNIYGTKKSDELLCYLANEYSEKLKGGLIARRGSSTFVCLTYDRKEIDHQKFESTIENIIDNAPISGVKIKYGIYENVNRNQSVSTLCDYASLAAETITDNYDCDVAYFTDEMAQKRIRSQIIENSFDEAISNHEFVVYYQPKVDINTEKVVGAEALVRWQKPDGSLVSPGEFIPVFEKDGLIEKIDEYVFEQVCRLQKSKLNEGAKLMPISVNLSRSSILHNGIANRYISIAQKNDIPFSCVPLELTESAAIYGVRIKNEIEELKNAGFNLHVDDFGSGFSSIAVLNQIPFSILKVDKSLIDDICLNKGRTLVEQVIMLAKVLNMHVIAEGVETKEQLDELRKMNCDEIQGFYYAKPMPESEFIEFVNNN